MRLLSWLGLVLGVGSAAVLAGCPGPQASSDSSGSSTGVGGANNTTSSGSASGGSSSSGVNGQCLPPDATRILGNNCQSCHSNPPVANAPMPLVTIADLQAASAKGGTVGDRSVIRMKDANLPMPPSGPISAADITTFETWVNNGMPTIACSSTSGAGGGDPYNTPPTCTTMQTWQGGDGWDMNPGEACTACHSKNPDAPVLGFGGTVYKTAHEPNNCYGVDGLNTSLTVIVTDKHGKNFPVNVKYTGNFGTSQGFPAFPVTAKVVDNTTKKERVMSSKVNTGDCNTCHTENGSGNPMAPGRIMAP